MRKLLSSGFKISYLKSFIPSMSYFSTKAPQNIVQIDQQHRIEIEETESIRQVQKAKDALSETVKEHPFLVKKLLDSIKHVKHGVQTTFEDAVYWSQLLQQKEMTIAETRDYVRISQDLTKMLPFSLFISIPLMELLIPPYIKLFPNAMPSGFNSETSKLETDQKKALQQEQSHYKLNKKVNKFLIEQGAEIRRMDSQDKIDEFMQKLQEVDGSMFIHKSSSNTLEQVGKFLRMPIIKGTNILSKLTQWIVNFPIFLIKMILKPFGHWDSVQWKSYDFKLNFGPFEYLKRKLLSYQINKHMNKIRKEDQNLNILNIDQIPLTHLKEMSKERCLKLDSTEQIKKSITTDWLKMSQDSAVTNSSLLWYSVLNYEKNDSECMNQLRFSK